MPLQACFSAVAAGAEEQDVVLTAVAPRRRPATATPRSFEDLAMFVIPF
jgi:hypothetical protein